MATDSHTHVVLKSSSLTHHVLPTSSSSLPPFGPSSVRVRPKIFALTANNLTYARLGSILGWYSTYPVPKSLPAPYNSRDEYGIVPAWGYATVLASTIPDLRPGALLWGYFPVSSLPTDLQLERTDGQGAWVETSPHRREAVMPFYQRYVETVSSSGEDYYPIDDDSLARDALLRPLFECAFLFNRFSLLPQVVQPPIHPFGTGLPWSNVDADLSKALVIFLAASSKTALLMAHQVKNARPAGSGPLLAVGVTSNRSKEFVQGTKSYSKVLTYEEAIPDLATEASSALETVTSSISGLERILLINCGSPSNIIPALMTQVLPSLSKAPVSLVAVGGEAKEQSPAEILEMMGKAAGMGLVQLNTSPLKEMATKRIGQGEYYRQFEREWRQFRISGGIPGLELRWNEGMVGPNGVEGCWDRLVKGEIDGRRGDVCRV